MTTTQALPAGRLLGTLWGPRCYEDGEDLP